ncbi:MAG TPA: hypothetical protein VFE47_19855 [Tepidisphaeraceae bacterium]|jgi:hypothetical protein|nr:hypothetical protein [Tepidisphaeraceae bacterium]
MNITTVFPVIQGRWGFYSCDRATFTKLRRLNSLVHRARVAEAAWSRWNRKLPKNRFCKTTVYDAAGRRAGRKLKLDAEGQPIPIPEPRRPIARETIGFSEVADLIVFDYRNARRPHAAPLEVEPLKLSAAQIDEQLARYEQWGEERP